jgi:phenylpropionate dioxygenase-like ring-hydroxylating dioxygenase large terminal subunit
MSAATPAPAPPRFPFPIPFGWFCVAYESDLEPGGVQPLKYFGRDLVLWRDESAGYHLLDAYCPHLGAHLGVGGEVVDGSIQCPFHGWRFGADGACTNIPYSEKLNRKAQIRSYPVAVRNGFVMAWYHPHDEPPAWEIPEIDQVADPDWCDYVSSSYIIHTIPQEMSENGVDLAHFRYVHHTETVAEVESYETDGPRSTMISRQSYQTPRGTVWGHIDVYNHGPGFSIVWFTGIVDALNVATTTPIDENTTQVRFNFTVKAAGGDAQMASNVAKAFIAEVNKQIEEDRPIWENKRFFPTPALADTDGPFMRFRRWYSQFYAEPYDLSAWA